MPWSSVAGKRLLVEDDPKSQIAAYDHLVASPSCEAGAATIATCIETITVLYIDEQATEGNEELWNLHLSFSEAIEIFVRIVDLLAQG